MARTKASVGAKVSSGKSSKARCSAAPPPSSAGTSSSVERSGGSGNPVCPRETPRWQKPITHFFSGGAADSSNPKPRRNVIESDEESLPSPGGPSDSNPAPDGQSDQAQNGHSDQAQNGDSDRSLNGDSDRIPDAHSDRTPDGDSDETRRPAGAKGKGVGKKTRERGKENVADNIGANKRDRELEDSPGSVSKKIKVN